MDFNDYPVSFLDVHGLVLYILLSTTRNICLTNHKALLNKETPLVDQQLRSSIILVVNSFASSCLALGLIPNPQVFDEFWPQLFTILQAKYIHD